MNLLILHLSDIHIKTEKDHILLRGQSIGRATYKNLSLVDAVVILLTGDLSFCGKKNEYILAESFISDVVESIRLEKNVPVKVLMCPGNHDSDFQAGSPDVREILLESIRTTSPDEVKDSIINECVRVQTEFFSFQDRLSIEKPFYDSRLWQAYKISVNGHVILFHLLNVAWMSKIKDDPGAIIFPLKRFEEVARTSSDATILAFHHPINWFSQASHRPFREFTRKSAHLILTGHEHVQSAAFIDDSDAGECVIIDGGILQDESVEISRFNMVLIDLEVQEYSVEFHEWDGNVYVPVEMEPAWSSFKRLPEKKRSEFAITPEFSKQLNDVGARFTHHKKTGDLSLEDVYVYPEMRPISEDAKSRLVVDSAGLRDPDKLKHGALVRGREKFGKTSLLKQLFRSYHDRGFVPVFLSGIDINRNTPVEVQKIVEKAYAKAYGEQAVLSFWQAGTERRLLLLDDLDDIKLSGDFLSKALQSLRSIFGLILITCSELYQLREYLLPSRFDLLSKFDHYEILEFGYKRRLDLIKRWANIGGNTYSPDKTIALIDQVEKLVTSVIGEGVVPSTPFFMLTLLQTVEAGSPANLQQSALGDYYRYLIIHSLELQKVSREEHAEILNYCAHLAWFMSQETSQRISVEAFAQFHHVFIEDHGLSLDFGDRKILLKETKLVEQVDGEYRSGSRTPISIIFFSVCF